jgi:hypothetical protein
MAKCQGVMAASPPKRLWHSSSVNLRLYASASAVAYEVIEFVERGHFPFAAEI